MKRPLTLPILGCLGLFLFLGGSYLGLVVAPPEKYMGEVGRILYVHVPTAWAALLACTAAFALAIGSLVTRSDRWDAAMEASVEVGCVLTAMLLVQGSFWAKPTWGVFWDWDPRLTSSAVLLLAYLAVLALRAFVDDPARRAAWSAVATIVAFVDVPIVYFSIKWWRTLHQNFSTSKNVDMTMVLPLRINAVALLLIAIWLIARRTQLSMAERGTEGVTVPPPSGSTIVAGGN